MLRSFMVAGALGFICILAFSLVGVYAKLEGIPVASNAPVAVGRSLGMATLVFMSLIMISSAGSTLDSAFASFSKNLALDLPIASGAHFKKPTVNTGIVVMIGLAILGNIPMLAGTDILKSHHHQWHNGHGPGSHLSSPWVSAPVTVELSLGVLARTSAWCPTRIRPSPELLGPGSWVKANTDSCLARMYTAWPSARWAT